MSALFYSRFVSKPDVHISAIRQCADDAEDETQNACTRWSRVTTEMTWQYGTIDGPFYHSPLVDICEHVIDFVESAHGHLVMAPVAVAVAMTAFAAP